MASTISLHEFLKRFPKVDIHYHMPGGVPVDTLMSLISKHGIDMSREDAESYYDRSEKAKGAVYALGLLYSLMREPEDLYRVAYETAKNSHEHGVRYQELFWNPDEVELSYTLATDAIISGFRAAQDECGIVSRIIPAINREKSPEIAYAMVKTVVANPYEEVLGIGIDYKEHDAPPEMFWNAYRLAKQAGLKLTAHCSEWEMPWRNVEAAIKLLQCDRIDHGYMVLESEELTAHCVKEGIPFTVVPSNTYYWRKFGGGDQWRKNHPLRAMAKAGLKIVPGTDDCCLHQTDATNCYRTLVEDFGFNLDHVRQFMLNGIDACWISEATKRCWKVEWAREYDQLRSQLNEEPQAAEDLQDVYTVV